MQARQDAEQLGTALDLALADSANEQAQGSQTMEAKWRREKPIWDRMETELARQVWIFDCWTLGFGPSVQT